MEATRGQLMAVEASALPSLGGITSQTLTVYIYATINCLDYIILWEGDSGLRFWILLVHPLQWELII